MATGDAHHDGADPAETRQGVDAGSSAVTASAEESAKDDDSRTSGSGSGTGVAAGAGLAGSAVVLFLLLRVMAVAHWHWSVAEDIAESVNFSSALGAVLGTLFARPEITGALVMLLAPLAIVDLVWCWIQHWPGSLGRWLLAVFFGVVLAVLTTTFGWWWLLTGSLILTGVLLAMRLSWRSGRRHTFIRTLLRGSGIFSLAAALILCVVVDTPWMVHERITTENEVVDGYVLETPSGFLRVLTDQPREVRILISGDVESREIIE